MVHPYADARVMAGQGTLVLELMRQVEGLQALVTPVGGGGLGAGCAIAAHGIDPSMAMYGAEPAGADDAARSLAQGSRIGDFHPDTICDGLRALVGEPNLDALRAHRTQLITVTDEETIAAMKLLWQELKQVVEVSSATVLAAVLKRPEQFAGRRVGLVLSGGNVDLEALPW
jgi:threonine dehydratase